MLVLRIWLWRTYRHSVEKKSGSPLPCLPSSDAILLEEAAVQSTQYLVYFHVECELLESPEVPKCWTVLSQDSTVRSLQSLIGRFWYSSFRAR